MGNEFRIKGVNIALGPVVGPLGRIASSGRNWEGTKASSIQEIYPNIQDLILDRILKRSLPLRRPSIRDRHRDPVNWGDNEYKGEARLQQALNRLR
jgi:hypothetical protein